MVTRQRRAACLATTLLLLAGCREPLDDRAFLVGDPRVLAIAAMPSEAAPKGALELRALYVGAQGDAPAADLDWAFCTARKPIGELGSIAPECLVRTEDALAGFGGGGGGGGGGDAGSTSASGPAASTGSTGSGASVPAFEPPAPALAPLGAGRVVAATMPELACRQFGPDVPVPEAGQPQARAADPDSTGGFYQPLRVRTSGAEGTPYEYVSAFARITCGLPAATPEQSAEYVRRSRPNAAPAIVELRAIRDGGEGAVEIAKPLAEDASGASTDETVSLRVRRGEVVPLLARWPACPTVDACGDGVCGVDELAQKLDPTTPDDDPANANVCPADCAPARGCAGAERYVVFDVQARELVVRREAVRVSWFTTAGSLRDDRTGRAESEADDPSTDNAWTAPETTGPALVWAVIRDDRGGTSWARYRFVVE